MSNSSLINVANSMVRPRSIYFSSQDVPEYSDASTSVFYLNESIHAEDGFDLVFGVRGFGYNATATNISKKQGNNSLRVILFLHPPEYFYNPTTELFTQDSAHTQVHSKTYDIYYPDGLYGSFEDILSLLSNPENYIIPAGYKYDVRSNQQIIQKGSSIYENDVKLKLTWQSRDGGFSIHPELIDDEIMNYYENGGEILQAKQVNWSLFSIKITQNPEYPKLYNQLFYNRLSQNSDHPGFIPLYENVITGQNPQTGIDFVVTNNLYYSPSSFYGEQIFANSSMLYTWKTTPDTHLVEKLALAFPLTGYTRINFPYIHFGLPAFNPIFVDVMCNLETDNITVSNHERGLLLRQFVLGGSNSNTSFFQAYDTPRWNKMSSGREMIDSVRIAFRSEDDLWDFFNMSFYLELLVFESPKTYEFESTPELYMGDLPASDPITQNANENIRQRNPFGEHHGTLYLMDPKRAELKKRSRG